MPRLLSALLIIVPLVACATKAPTTSAKEPKVVESAGPHLQAPEAAVPIPAPDPSAVAVSAPQLSPELIRDRLQVKDFQFTKGSNPSVSMTVVNLLAEKEMKFELAAQFLGADGKPVYQSDWFRVELKAGKRHGFYVETSNQKAEDARVLLRLVENAAADSKQP